jgi:hypothetical protein
MLSVPWSTIKDEDLPLKGQYINLVGSLRRIIEADNELTKAGEDAIESAALNLEFWGAEVQVESGHLDAIGQVHSSIQDAVESRLEDIASDLQDLEDGLESDEEDEA